MNERVSAIATIALPALGVSAGLASTRTSAAPRRVTQLVLRGRSNSILGNFALVGLGFALSADTTFTVGQRSSRPRGSTGGPHANETGRG